HHPAIVQLAACPLEQWFHELSPTSGTTRTVTPGVSPKRLLLLTLTTWTSSTQTTPFMASNRAFSTLSISGFLVGNTSPASAAARFFFDQDAATVTTIFISTITGPVMTSRPRIAMAPAAATVFS